MRRLATILVFVLLSGAASTAMGQAVGGAPAGVSGGGGSRFAGSMVSLRPTVSALSLDKSAEPTYNPYVATELMLAPRLGIGQRVSLSAMLIATREHTNSDWTSDAGESTLSDTFVTANVRILTIRSAGLSLSGAVQLRLPSSKASQARTLMLGTLGGLTAAWSKPFTLFGVQQRVSLVLIGRAGKLLHRYAEASLETPWLTDCGALPTGCARFAHSGARNIDWRTQLISSLSYQAHPKVSVSIQVGSFYDLLVPLTTAKTQGLTIEPDPTDPSARGIVFYIVSLAVQPHPAFSIAAGTETASAHLAPDSTYRKPFFNRSTLLFIALRMFPAALL